MAWPSSKVLRLATRLLCQGVTSRGDGDPAILYRMTLDERIYRRVTGMLPGSMAGRLDLLRPSLRSSWGGPLNGQRHRREIVREISRSLNFDQIVETGTFRGTGADFFAAVFDAPVTTIEANPRFFLYSQRMLAYQKDVSVILGDSRRVLRRLAEEPMSEHWRVFFYLDAHWKQDLPLREELEIIARRWPKSVIMIDDFEVPGDPGYGYDDYGEGKRLTESYLPAEVLNGWTLFYPAAPSAEETGARRGSCVLVGPEIDSRAFAALRPAGTYSAAKLETTINTP